MIDNFPKVYFDTPNFDTHDISTFFGDFITEFFSLISTMLNLLDSIEIFGVGLLNLLVAFFVIGFIVPIILTVVNSRAISSYPERRSERKKKRLDRKGKKEWKKSYSD